MEGDGTNVSEMSNHGGLIAEAELLRPPCQHLFKNSLGIVRARTRFDCEQRVKDSKFLNHSVASPALDELDSFLLVHLVNRLREFSEIIFFDESTDNIRVIDIALRT